MLDGSLGNFRRVCLGSAAFATFLLAEPVYAQAPDLRGAVDTTVPTSPAGPLPNGTTGSNTAPDVATSRDTTPASGIAIEPGFHAHLTGNASESYVANALGAPGAQQPDYLTTIGVTGGVHEHSRRVSLDATYAGTADFYAQNTLPTQFYNNLQALGTMEAIPDYLTLAGRAFAQPVMLSETSVVTAGNRVVPNGFRNSYGYDVDPDLKFRLGDIAASETMPRFAQIFFTTPPGSSSTTTPPGFLTTPFPAGLAAQDTTLRSLTERITSGPDFIRFNWSMVGQFSEVDRIQGLLSEKTGIANLSYALSHEFALLATGGYDSINNTTGLLKNVSGPVALGGFALTFGENFALKLEAGTKYNSASLNGNLRYNITPTSSLVASADDYVQTPEGQLLNNLTNLTALNDGSLASSQDVLGNGSTSSLSPFDIQSPGSPSLNQNISRYQVASVSYLKEFVRDRASVQLFGTRRTYLNGTFVGPSTVNYWGSNATFAHDFTPLLTGTLVGTYTINDELGGHAHIYSVEGSLSYSLSRETRIYLRSDYRERSTSGFTGTLAPLAGNASDIRVTVGLSHDFF